VRDHSGEKMGVDDVDMGLARLEGGESGWWYTGAETERDWYRTLLSVHYLLLVSLSAVW
jgi:hypothetical protein